ncbi:MAG: RNA polymerase subunit sigma, partial [Desulfuromonadales bacterium]|nr:RNA polymerase subunit sigma [Desulfuromonadales bacterium]
PRAKTATKKKSSAKTRVRAQSKTTSRAKSKTSSATASAAATPTPSAAAREEKNEKIKELVKLANEQGYLTYGDVNDNLPENILSADDLDSILILLRGMDIDIIDASEVDRYKKDNAAEEEKEQPKADSRLDILDDPVRMYLKQMGQVPLLTREQEVEISKRIETAENHVRGIINGLGITATEHLALAKRLSIGRE